MDALVPFVNLALPATGLLLLTWLVMRLRSRRSDRRQSQREALDTIGAWPPEAARILSISERQAYDLLRRAMPGFLVLAQVPLSRFIRVPSRHSYSEWLSRVGSLNADLLLCDSGSRVLAMIDIRPPTESVRARRRHERMARVLRAANIHVYTWREGDFPSAVEVRTALLRLVSADPANPKPIGTGPMPLIPVAEMSEVLAEGDRAAMEAEFDPAMEPVPSAFLEEMEPEAARR